MPNAKSLVSASGRSVGMSIHLSPQRSRRRPGACLTVERSGRGQPMDIEVFHPAGQGETDHCFGLLSDRGLGSAALAQSRAREVEESSKSRTSCGGITGRLPRGHRLVQGWITALFSSCDARREHGRKIIAADYIDPGHIRIPIPSGRTPTENTAITEFVPASTTVTIPDGVFDAT